MKSNNQTRPARIMTKTMFVLAWVSALQPSADLLAYALPGNVAINIAGARWSDGGCPPPSTKTSPDPMALPIRISSKCDRVVGTAGATARTYQMLTNPCSWPSSPVTTWTFEVDVGETGCEQKITYSEDRMSCVFEVFAPKRNGAVTIQAWIDGECLTNPQNSQDACDYVDVQHRWSVKATIEVELTKNCDGSDATGSCQAGDANLGDGEVDNDNGPSFTMHLGPAGTDQSAGILTLRANTPSAGLSLPSSLSFPFNRTGTELVPVSGGGYTKQAKVPQGLVHVVPIADHAFEVRVYYDKDLERDSNGNYEKNGNFYVIKSGSSPFVTWRVRNPTENDPETDFNSLELQEVRLSQTRTNLYEFETTDSKWTLTYPGGLKKLITKKVQNGGAFDYWREILYDGQTESRTIETRDYAPALLSERVLQVVRGVAGGATETTEYDYYPSGAGGAAYRLRRVDYPDKRWVFYQYDSQGRVSVEYSALGNTAPPTDKSVTPNETTCKKTEYSYVIAAEGNGPGIVYDETLTVVSLPLTGNDRQVISRTFHRYTPGSPTDMDETRQCRSANAGWDASENLFTMTFKYASGDFKNGKLSSISRPDRTATVYEYYLNTSSGEITVTEYSGEADYWATSAPEIVNGTKAVTLLDANGKPISRTTTAIRNGVADEVVLASETYNYESAPGVLYDELRRSYDVTTLSGAKTQYRYSSCCSPDYFVSPDGVTNYQVLEAELNRNVGTRELVAVGQGGQELCIWRTNKLDAAGRVLLSNRVGTNGNVITLSETTYDVLGRVLTEKNALTGPTTHSESFDTQGQRIVTTTNPDAGTRIETYYRDGLLKSVTGTAALPVFYEYGVDANGPFTKEAKGSASGDEWTKTYTDLLGRTARVVYSPRPGVDDSNDPPAAEYSYNDLGQLEKQVDPDGVATLYRYNGEGQLVVTAVDVDQDGYVDDYDQGHSGNDRVTKTTTTILGNGETGNTRDADIRRVVSEVWTTDDTDDSAKVSMTETAANGLTNWHTVYRTQSDPATTTNITVLATAANDWTRTITQTGPDGVQTVSVYVKGRLQSVTRKDNTSNHAQITGTTYGYDAHGRQATVSDARNGMTTYAYNNADLVTTVTTPHPGSLGGAPQTTTTYYDTSLRAWKVTQPDGANLTNEFYPTGLPKRSYGTRTYPVGYGYDYAGRMTMMTNWSGFDATAANGGTGRRVTTWNYNPYRGWLDSKDYPNASNGDPPGTPGTTGPTYDYTPGGRLDKRTWRRIGTGSERIATLYKYGFNDAISGNEYGDLAEISYADDPQGTLPIAYAYDRLGRQTAVTQTGGSALTRTYNDAGQLLTETHTAGPLDGLAVTNGYDAYLRRTNLVLLNAAATILHHTAYTYDSAGRLWAVTNKTASPMVSATYSYLANSPLVEQIALAEYASSQWQLRMTTTKAYDKLNRLTAIASVGTGATPSPISYAYQYNTANQRTRAKLADGSYWNYEYDALGQVKRGAKFFSDGYPVPGQQFEYAHDDIGNRTGTKAGGDENGANLRPASYTANSVNQYTSRDIPRKVDVFGLALGTATVTVTSPNALNNTVAPWRKLEYFRKEVAFADNTSPLWETITVTATDETDVPGKAFLPGNPEQFDDPATTSVNEGYDDDGNQLRDGRWSYTWDAENRLVQIVKRFPSTDLATIPHPTTGAPTVFEKVTYEYDHSGRRIAKRYFTTAAGTTAFRTDNFVYDGWNLIVTLNSELSTINSFTWGLDLSGTPQGAGGVGGLLAVGDTANGVHFCAYDGNGNIAALVKASDSQIKAEYEYGPFGEPLRMTGTMAKANPIRFSSKYQDDETDLLYYGYRSFNPSLGRWLSRDPIGERGGINLYGFIANAPVNRYDVLGLTIPGTGPGAYDYPPYNCGKCKCKKVTVTPGNTISTSVHFPSLDIGVRVPIKIEVEGDRSKCKCKATDSGTFKWGPNQTEVKYDPKKEHTVPGCKDYSDQPGLGNNPGEPPFQPFPPGVNWNGQVDGSFHFNYDMTITVTCEDSDGSGSVSGSAPVRGDYQFSVTYQNNTTVIITPR